jgi:hypothetical protein
LLLSFSILAFASVFFFFSSMRMEPTASHTLAPYHKVQSLDQPKVQALSLHWLFFFFFFFSGTGVWTQGSTAWATPLVHFILVILEMGGVSHKLFVWAGLKPKSSRSQPPK